MRNLFVSLGADCLSWQFILHAANYGCSARLASADAGSRVAENKTLPVPTAAMDGSPSKTASGVVI